MTKSAGFELGLAIALLVAVVAASSAWVRSIRSSSKLARLERELDLFARLDPLTGVYNRRHLDDVLSSASSIALRHSQPLGILMLNIDNFKEVNDTYGQVAGNLVLRAVSARTVLALRHADVLGRWSADEMLAILPMTPVKGAREAAERIRRHVCAEAIPIGNGQSAYTTVSIGCASSDGRPGADVLVERASSALFEAKETGKNKVVVVLGDRDEPARPAAH